MRIGIASLLVLIALDGSVFAQYAPLRCAAPQDCCVPQPRVCCPPSPKPQLGPAPEGVFVAPVQRGEVASEAHSFGLRFGELKLPAITIPFPTIQLPSLIRFRRDAHMITESGIAPFVTRPPADFRVSPHAAPQRKPAPKPEKKPAPPCYLPPAPAACGQLELQQQLEARTVQVAQMQAELAELQQLCQKILANRETQIAEAQQPESSPPIGSAQYEVSAPTPPAIDELPATIPDIDKRVVPVSRDISDDEVDGETPFGEIDTDVDSLMSADDATVNRFGEWHAKRAGKATFRRADQKRISYVVAKQPRAGYVAASAPEGRSSLERRLRQLFRR